MISTKNRSDFLIRLLNYYADRGCKHWIYIGDSSEGPHLRNNQEAVAKLQKRLKIRHFRHQGLSLPASVRELANSVTTAYATFISDDDFLISETLNKAVKFLEDNPQYSVVQGEALIFSLKSSGPYGEFLGTGRYNLRAVEEDSAVQRLKNHLNNYSVTLFGVCRTQDWRRMYREVNTIKDKRFADELLPCSLSVIYGKVKKLNSLYLIRQGHDRRNILPDLYDWITDSYWQPSYNIFSNCLIEALMEQDGISQDIAYRVVKQSFWAYIRRGFNVKYEYTYRQPSLAKRTKYMLKRIPFLLETVQFIKSFFLQSMSLEALLRKNSSYHVDFLPVYRAVKGIRSGINT
jgi:glycosyltransferase domain-containing protein